jgi:DNA-binding CsgD family transcriptional regulator/tetratricopeptide (TPR) repeat protein
MSGRVTTDAFVGRVAELTVLQAALRDAVGGTPSTVLVGGEAGVGKTRLVQHFASQVADEVQLLLGRCINLSGGGLPYGPVVDALRGLLRDSRSGILQTLPEPLRRDLIRLVRSGDRDEPLIDPSTRLAQARLFESVLRLLDHLGERAPVLLILEDLHWADRSTLDLLLFTVGMVRHERLLLLATYRSDELQPDDPLNVTLVELDRTRRVEHLELAPFEVDELRTLLAGLLGHPQPTETVQRILERSGGNAFLVEELLAVSDLRFDGQLPPRLRQGLLARVRPLGPDVGHVLRVLATVARPVAHPLLAAASRLSEERLLPAVRAAVDHHVLVTMGDSQVYAFRHALFQEAVFGELLPGERIQLHEAIARALTSDQRVGGLASVNAAELAYHWDAAGHRPEALRASIAAARAATDRYGFVEAHQRCERSLELWSQVPDAPEQTDLTFTELLLLAAAAARRAGAPDRGATLIQDALTRVDPTVDPAEAGELHTRLADCLWEAGDGKAAVAAYEAGCRLVADQPPSAEKARVLAAYAAALMREGKYGASKTYCEEAIIVARTVGARALEGHALNTLGCDLGSLGDPDRGVAALKQARELAEEAGAFDDIARAYINLCGTYAYAGRLKDALAAGRQGLDRMRQLGLEYSAPADDLHQQLAWALWYLGRWSELEELLRQASVGRPSFWRSLLAEELRGRLHMARGRFEQAQTHADTMAGLITRTTEAMIHAQLQLLLAELATWRGEHAAARSAVARGLRQLAETEEFWFSIVLCAHGLRAEADAAERLSGRVPSELPDIRATAEDLLAHARDLAGRYHSAGIPVASAGLALCEAEFTRLEQRSDPHGWAAVAHAWEELAEPYASAYALWRQAEALLARKRSKETAVVLRRAHHLAAGLDARPLLREIELIARQGRIGLHESAPEPASAAHPQPVSKLGLTQREQQVLRHLVEGDTNRKIASALFISEKTASVHVSNIMAKLNASSRTEAALIAHRLGLVDGPG